VILVDFSAISIGNIASQRLPPDENLLRHMILNSLRAYNKKNRDKYGQMVICCDHSSWRKTYYEFYKYSRKKGRDESSINWEEMFKIVNKVTDEIRTYIPWKVIQHKGAEADDIIATLAQSTQELGKSEPVLIVASDGDYKQLQVHSNVKQISTLTKKMVKEKNPHLWLFEQCVKGQGKDGVPNIFSPHDFYKRKVDGEDVGRQKAVSKKRLADLWENRNNLESYLPPEQWSAFMRNKKLMDFTMIPDEIQAEVMKQYDEYELPNFGGVMNYLIKNRAGNLLNDMNDFKQGTL